MHAIALSAPLLAQAGAVLVRVGVDVVIRVRVGPDNAKVVAVIVGRIVVAQSTGNVGQGIVLPAYQDVARAGVVVHDVGNAVGVVALARGVDNHAERVGERLDGVVGALLRAIWPDLLALLPDNQGVVRHT